MRALCALYVVLGHIANIVDPARALLKPSKAPVWMQTLFRPFQEGHLAVAAFIVISGFCLAHAALERDDPRLTELKSFFTRRCLRILPAYYACLAISTLVAWRITPIPGGMPFAQYIPVTKANLAAHVFMVHNLRPDWMYKINGVLWSIAIEFQLYFLFPGIMRTLKRWGWLTTLVMGAAIAFTVVDFVPHGVKLYAWYLPLFSLGAVGAVWARRKFLRPELMLLGAVGMGISIWGCGHKWDLWLTDSCFALGILAVLVLGTHAGSQSTQSRNPLLQSLKWKPLVLVGSFSYSLYLMHHPVLQSLFIFRPKTVHSQTAELIYLVVVGLPLILLIAFGFGLVCERRWVQAALSRFRT
jgi:peptidoglycan/LPS O-acetylase OafA/YrhL